MAETPLALGPGSDSGDVEGAMANATNHLRLFAHALTCHSSSWPSNTGCPLGAKCAEAKSLLKHVITCNKQEVCSLPACAAIKNLLLHFVGCPDATECPVCSRVMPSDADSRRSSGLLQQLERHPEASPASAASAVSQPESRFTDSEDQGSSSAEGEVEDAAPLPPPPAPVFVLQVDMGFPNEDWNAHVSRWLIHSLLARPQGPDVQPVSTVLRGKAEWEHALSCTEGQHCSSGTCKTFRNLILHRLSCADEQCASCMSACSHFFRHSTAQAPGGLPTLQEAYGGDIIELLDRLSLTANLG